MEFSEKLQTLRKNAGLSQEALADKLGVSRQAVSKWESGAAYPETEKILTLCQLYNVSADELLLGAETGPQKAEKSERKRSVWPWMAAVGFLAAILSFALWRSAVADAQVKQQLQTNHLEALTRAQETLIQERDAALQARQQLALDQEAMLLEKAALLTERDALQEKCAGLADEVLTLNEALERLMTTQPNLEESREITALLQTYFYDFGQKWRLDYIPYFEEGQAPTESADYLMWAFAINLDGWGEPLAMSKDYVHDAVLQNFGVYDVSHTPLRKTWDFDGEKYVPSAPWAYAELPIYLLTDFSVSEGEYGVVYTVELTEMFVIHDGFQAMPVPEDYVRVREELCAGEPFPSGLEAGDVERFVFVEGLDGPVFKAHTLVNAPQHGS